MVSLLVVGVLYAFAATAQPGPLQTYVVSQALSSGWRRTWPAAFAPLLSDGPIAFMVIVILSQVPPWLISSLQVAGGLFLLYLAFGAWKAWREFNAQKKPHKQTGARSLLKAALINLFNPNPYIGWSLVMGPLVVKAWHEAPVRALVLLLGFYGTMIGGMIAIIIAASAAGGIGPRVNRSLLGLSAIALACFAFYEIWLGLGSLNSA